MTVKDVLKKYSSGDIKKAIKILAYKMASSHATRNLTNPGSFSPRSEDYNYVQAEKAKRNFVSLKDHISDDINEGTEFTNNGPVAAILKILKSGKLDAQMSKYKTSASSKAFPR